MKKHLALILCVLMVFALTACGENSSAELTHPASSSARAAMTVILAPDTDADVTAEQLEYAQEFFESRLSALKQKDAVVTVEDAHQIRIELSARLSAEQIDSLVGFPELTFRDEDGRTVLDGKDIQSVFVSIKNGIDTIEPIIQMNFTDEGMRRLADVTEQNIGRCLALYLDDTMLFNPTVVAAITNGQLQMMGFDDVDKAQSTAVQIGAAILPFGFRVVSVE